MGLSDRVTDEEANDDDSSCHDNEKDEGIESLYDLENYDNDKGVQKIPKYPSRIIFTPSSVQVSPCLELAWVTVSLVWPTLLLMRTTLTSPSRVW